MALLQIVKLLQSPPTLPPSCMLWHSQGKQGHSEKKNPVKKNDKPVLEVRLLENKRVFVSSETNHFVWKEQFGALCAIK